MPAYLIPQAFTAGRSITLDGQSFEPGDTVSWAVLAGCVNLKLSALVSSRRLIPVPVDTHNRRTRSHVPTPTDVSARVWAQVLADGGADPGDPPTITALEPDTATVDDPDFEAHVRGTGFTSATTIVWGGGKTEATTFVDETDVWTLVSPSSVTGVPLPFTDQVTVHNGDGVNVDPALPFVFTEGAKARTKVHPGDRIIDTAAPGDTDALDAADEGDPVTAWGAGEAATFGTAAAPWDATWDGAHWVAVEEEPEPEPPTLTSVDPVAAVIGQHATFVLTGTGLTADHTFMLTTGEMSASPLESELKSPETVWLTSEPDAQPKEAFVSSVYIQSSSGGSLARLNDAVIWTLPSEPQPEPPTGADAGSPGAWTPDGSKIPTSLAEANGLGLSLGSAWAEGEYVTLGNARSTTAYWDGSSFSSGSAPKEGA